VRVARERVEWRPPAERQALLQDLWLISHFGWIAEATIRRALVISGTHEIPAVSLAERLRQLLNRGWVDSATATSAQTNSSGG
jgi:hypothetical protein